MEEGYFERHSAHFLRRIYETPKGKIRLAVLARDLDAVVGDFSGLSVLDVGGGSGQMAAFLLARGATVTLLDASPSLLATAEQLTAPWRERFRAHCGDARCAADYPPARFDVVCCHAVLEWLPDAEGVLRHLRAHCKSGGVLSLLYYNGAALRFAQHVFGNFDYLDRGLRAKKKARLTPDYPRDRAEVLAMVQNLGWAVVRESGVRCFFDYMKPKDRERHSEANLIARELALSAHPDYFAVARYLHLLARA